MSPALSERIARFAQEAPSGTITTDDDVVAAYSRDQCRAAPAGVALALARPRSTDDVSLIVRAAAAHSIPVVARGLGTGLAGGANAIDGSVILSLEAMNQIVEIDERDLVAVVQPGVINGDLKRAAAEHSLWYPPDPASADISSLGGNIATNAGGMCCMKYGCTREYVLGLHVVLANGDITRLGHRSRKGVAGLDLTSLIVGSEGTLGIITEATLRLVPKPSPPRTAVAYFDDVNRAGSVAGAIGTSGLQPSMLEIMDGATMRAVERYKPCGLDTTMEALVIAQTDLPGESGEREIGAIAEVLRTCGAVWITHSDDPADSEPLIMARKLAYPALEHATPVLLDDVAVPLSRVGEMMAEIQRIAHRVGVEIATFGHAGDGNLHPTIVDTDPVATRAAFVAIVAAAQLVGGTATGEHGVGSLKRDLLAHEIDGRSASLQRDVKAVFDPWGILNPNKALRNHDEPEMPDSPNAARQRSAR